MGDYFLYNWCTSENKGSSGGSGDGDGCGIMLLLFFVFCLISGTCNNSGGNENYMKPSDRQIEVVDDVNDPL